MIYLYWAWGDSEEHATRRAAYQTVEDALLQAKHDLELCEQSGDYQQAPLYILADGKQVWAAPDRG